MLKHLNEAGVAHDEPFSDLRSLLKTVETDLTGNTMKECAVVFSPVATSFGMFQNELDCANKYMQLVREIFTCN